MKAALSLVGATLLLALPGLAHALTDYCVGDSQQLDAAFEALPYAGDSIVRIKIREGSYQAGTGVLFISSLAHSNQIVEISGGWGGPNGSCQNKRFGASRTILNGSAASPALYVNTGANVTGNTLSVTDLTLRNTVYNGANSSACLALYVYPGSQGIVDRVKLDACTMNGNSVSSMYLQNQGGELTARNIVTTGGSSAHSGAVAVSTSGGAVTRLSQLSIAANKGGDPSAFAGLYVYNDSSFTYVANSVVWNNQAGDDAKDIYSIGSGIYFNRMHYDTFGGSATSVAPSGGDPGFLAPRNPHLRASSLLIDSGLSNPNGGSGTFDVEGRARAQGAGVDVGAYEVDPDAIFIDAFDQ